MNYQNSSSYDCLCSDGGGRSGVYLAIDANLELAEEEDCFDVFGYLKKLRQSRKGLIENEVRTNKHKLIVAVSSKSLTSILYIKWYETSRNSINSYTTH